MPSSRVNTSSRRASLREDHWRSIVDYLTPVAVQYLSVCCKEWNTCTNYDGIWGPIVARYFPFTRLSPITTWKSVFLVEAQRKFHSNVSSALPMCEPVHVVDRRLGHSSSRKSSGTTLALEVLTHGQKYILTTTASQFLTLKGTVKQLRSRGIVRRKMWKSVVLSLNEAVLGVHKRADELVLHFKYSLYDIRSVSKSVTVENGLSITTDDIQIELVVENKNSLAAWITSIRHNMNLLRRKRASLDQEIMLSTLIDRRKYRGSFYRNKRVSARCAQSEPCLSLPVSITDLAHFRAKSMSSTCSSRSEQWKYSVEMDLISMHFEKKAKACCSCGLSFGCSTFDNRIVLDSAGNSFCSNKCSQFYNTIRSKGFTIDKNELIFLEQPKKIISKYLDDEHCFEGQIFRLFVARYKDAYSASEDILRGYISHVREFLLNVEHYIVNYRHDELAPMGKNLNDLKEAIYLELERQVFCALQKTIRAWILKCVSRHEKKLLKKKLQPLKQLDQRSPCFGISKELISPSNWISVSMHLQLMGKAELPSQKLKSLLNAAKEIYLLYDREHHRKQPLSADDFLPIFIYCIVKGNVHEPLYALEMMWGFCQQTALEGETGYYLTMFEAALEYIQNT